MSELLELAKGKALVLIGDYRIEYKGIKIDTATGKTESWIITKKLPLLEEGKDNEKDKN